MPKIRLKRLSPKTFFSYFSAHFFFIVGFLLIIFSIYWSFYETTVPSFNDFKPEIKIAVVRHNKPVRLIIPGKSINLEIKEAVIANNNWEINPTGASHLTRSANPGDKGNIIIYGHNKKKILGSIVGMKIGDQLAIIDEQGLNHNYRVYQTLTVKPSDVWVLDNTKEETLTLYTCSGLFDSKRFVIKAEPVPNF